MYIHVHVYLFIRVYFSHMCCICIHVHAVKEVVLFQGREVDQLMSVCIIEPDLVNCHVAGSVFIMYM